MQTAVTRKGRWRLAPAFVLLTSPAPVLPPAVTAVAEDGRAVSFHVHITHEATAGAVNRAVAGAFERLGEARCQELFADFADAEGRPLQRGLDELGVSGQSYLGLVVFYDGRASGTMRLEGRAGGDPAGRAHRLRLRRAVPPPGRARPPRGRSLDHPRGAPHPRPGREPAHQPRHYVASHLPLPALRLTASPRRDRGHRSRARTGSNTGCRRRSA